MGEPFDQYNGKRAKTLLKSEREHFHHIYWSLWRRLGSKKFLWVICKILGLFVNPLTANDKYSLPNRGNLLQHFQMHLSQKRKIFSEFFFTFSKFAVNFEDFQRKDDPHSRCIFEFKDSEKLRWRNVYKVLFQKTLSQGTW